MSEVRVKIIGMHVRDHVKKHGSIDLAAFDCIVSGIKMIGCMLIKTHSGGFIARAPIVPSDRVKFFTGAIEIVDHAVLQSVTEAARRVYIDFGGKHGALGKSTAAPQATQVDAKETEDADPRAGLLAVLNVQPEKSK